MASGILEERTFSEVTRLCRAGLDGPELLRATIERLRRVVPFEAYCASTVDPLSGLVTRSLAEEMGGAEEAEIFFERLYFEHDLTQLTKMARDRRPVALLSDTAGGRLERSARHRELLGPLGLAHEMRVVFSTGGSMWGSMDLIREKGRPDFEPRHVALLRRLASPLGDGLRAAALRVQTIEEPGGTDPPGVLTLGRGGRVVQHTPAAERWLRDIDDLRPGWREWAGLPPAIRMVCGALERALSRGSDGGVGPRLRVRGRSGRWLTLHGSRTEATSERPAETVIVVEPTKPEEVAWLNVASYGLSAREQEVIQLVVRGASTRQISTALHISEYTVQNHLSNVFEKVGVRSRKELVRRLFFENLYPTLFG